MAASSGRTESRPPSGLRGLLTARRWRQSSQTLTAVTELSARQLGLHAAGSAAVAVVAAALPRLLQLRSFEDRAGICVTIERTIGHDNLLTDCHRRSEVTR